MPGLTGEADVATFKAIVIEKVDGGTKAALADFDEVNLMDGDVTVRVEYSTLNYKDGLAITGKAPVVRRFPMIGGIDFAGTVESSTHAGWKQGDKVILNGWGCGESHLGAYAEKARVKGEGGSAAKAAPGCWLAVLFTDRSRPRTITLHSWSS